MLPLHALRERIAREEEAQDEVNKRKKQVNKKRQKSSKVWVTPLCVCVWVKGERALNTTSAHLMG